MFAIVDNAAFQEKVQEGDALRVPLLAGKEGDTVKLDQVLLLADGDNIQVGTPTLSGATVELKIVGHGRGDKIRVVKMKRRKRYRRVHGHRQDFTDVEVVKIGGAKKTTAKKEEKPAEEKKTEKNEEV